MSTLKQKNNYMEEENKIEQKEETKAVEVPKKFQSIVSEIEKMSVIDLYELVKILEEKFGVSAAAMAASGGGDGGGADEGPSTVSVELVDSGSQKVAVIKVVKDILGLGLKEGKDIVDAAPSMIKEGIEKAEAEEIKAKIEEAGGTASIK